MKIQLQLCHEKRSVVLAKENNVSCLMWRQKGRRRKTNFPSEVSKIIYAYNEAKEPVNKRSRRISALKANLMRQFNT